MKNKAGWRNRQMVFDKFNRDTRLNQMLNDMYKKSVRK